MSDHTFGPDTPPPPPPPSIEGKGGADAGRPKEGAEFDDQSTNGAGQQTYDKNEKAFYFTNGPFGIFRVRDAQMFAINREVAARRGDTPMSLGAFLADVATKVASVR